MSFVLTQRPWWKPCYARSGCGVRALSFTVLGCLGPAHCGEIWHGWLVSKNPCGGHQVLQLRAGTQTGGMWVGLSSLSSPAECSCGVSLAWTSRVSSQTWEPQMSQLQPTELEAIFMWHKGMKGNKVQSPEGSHSSLAVRNSQNQASTPFTKSAELPGCCECKGLRRLPHRGDKHDRIAKGAF